jgi:hypothetical protein
MINRVAAVGKEARPRLADTDEVKAQAEFNQWLCAEATVRQGVYQVSPLLRHPPPLSDSALPTPVSSEATLTRWS